MREKIEDIAVVLVGIPIVLGMTALYWVCRLCGVEVDE